MAEQQKQQNQNRCLCGFSNTRRNEVTVLFEDYEGFAITRTEYTLNVPAARELAQMLTDLADLAERYGEG